MVKFDLLSYQKRHENYLERLGNFKKRMENIKFIDIIHKPLLSISNLATTYILNRVLLII